MKSEAFYNTVNGDRITSRQIDELVGLARGVAADGTINQSEVEFLQKWLAANMAISDQPMIRRLYQRINAILADGVADPDECRELLETLNSFSSRDFELGEVLKATTLPLAALELLRKSLTKKNTADGFRSATRICESLTAEMEVSSPR